MYLLSNSPFNSIMKFAYNQYAIYHGNIFWYVIHTTWTQTYSHTYTSHNNNNLWHNLLFHVKHFNFKIYTDFVLFAIIYSVTLDIIYTTWFHIIRCLVWMHTSKRNVFIIKQNVSRETFYSIVLLSMETVNHI